MPILWNLLPFYLSSLVGIIAMAAWGVGLLVKGRRKSKPPQDEALLRPPGHTLSEKLAAHFEVLLVPAGAVFFGSGLVGTSFWTVGVALYQVRTDEVIRNWIAENGITALWTARNAPWLAVSLAAFFLSGMALIWWGRRGFREWLRERHRLQMGLRGEQAVAEELQVAVRAGYHLFHDLPGPKGNIDHVVVGPGGVFAIETKARSKGISQGVNPDHWAEFDGKQLRFSDGRVDTTTARQAEAIANDLTNKLSQSTGDRVRVIAVIALPGWWVERNLPGEIWARNPRYLAKELANMRRQISDEQIDRVVYQLDQICRDVSFDGW